MYDGIKWSIIYPDGHEVDHGLQVEGQIWTFNKPANYVIDKIMMSNNSVKIFLSDIRTVDGVQIL